MVLGLPNNIGMEALTLIRQLGGISETARVFGVKPPSVSEWAAKRRIPPLRIFQLREIRPDLFKPALAPAGGENETADAALVRGDSSS